MNSLSTDYEVAARDLSNQRVMRSVVAAYEIPAERQPEVMEAALLRCLQHHRPGRQQFTTSLHRFTVWACLNALRKSRRRPRPLRLSSLPEPPCPVHDRQTDIEHIHECMGMLSVSDEALIRQYYLERLTLDEIGRLNSYTREAARQNLGRALDRLREICLR